MTAGGPGGSPPFRPKARRWSGVAAAAYGLSSLSVAVAIEVVVSRGVPDPHQLLVDISGRRVLWMAAQVVLIAQQALLVPIAVALIVTLGPSTRAVTASGVALLGLAGTAFVNSGVVHGVLGAHLVSDFDDSARDLSVTIAQAEVAHALADTFYFVGVVAAALALCVLAVAVRRSSGLPRGVARLGVATAAAQGTQFGWFFLPELGAAAAVGGILQTGWFLWLGRGLWRPGVVPAIP